MKKRIIFINLIFFAAAMLFSCSKSFLDVPVQGGETINADPTLAAEIGDGCLSQPDAGRFLGKW